MLSPLSPFGPVLALLLFPSLGRFQLQYSPSHGSLTTHCCIANQPAQDVRKRSDGRLFVVSFYGIQPSRSLRSPYGFQCFPFGIIQGAENSFLPINPCSCERMRPVFQHECWCIRRAQLSYTFTRVSATPKCGFVLLRAHLLIFASLEKK